MGLAVPDAVPLPGWYWRPAGLGRMTAALDWQIRFGEGLGRGCVARTPICPTRAGRCRPGPALPARHGPRLPRHGPSRRRPPPPPDVAAPDRRRAVGVHHPVAQAGRPPPRRALRAALAPA